MDEANTIKLWIHKAAKEEDVTNLFVSFERCGELKLSRTPLGDLVVCLLKKIYSDPTTNFFQSSSFMELNKLSN